MMASLHRRARLGWTARLLSALGFAVSAGAQTIAITGGTVFPVTGPRIEQATVLIRDGKIAAVGDTVHVPPDATVINATGKWVTPGLVNAGSPLGVEEIENVSGVRDTHAGGDHGIAAAFTMADGFNPASPLIPEAREAGVTSVVVVPWGNLISGQAAFVDLAPGTITDMTLRAPAAMVGDIGDPPAAAMRARGEMTAALRALLDDVKRYAAHRTAYDAGHAPPYAASRANLEALIPVVQGHEPLALRADRASDIEDAIAVAREYRLSLIIVGGAEAWQVAADLAAAHAIVMTGSLINIPRNFAELGSRQDNAALLREAGVPVVLMGNSDEEDATPYATRNIRQDAGTAVAYGLPWDEALRSVTLTPAEAFGVADRVGSLAPGREANVVVWSGDPFEFSTRAEHVFVRGREIHDVSRDDLLTARYKTLPPRYLGTP
jgi:imidazolonepropionase-like amidohydrolase